VRIPVVNYTPKKMKIAKMQFSQKCLHLNSPGADPEQKKLENHGLPPKIAFVNSCGKLHPPQKKKSQKCSFRKNAPQKKEPSQKCTPKRRTVVKVHVSQVIPTQKKK
jgi:hypothetical protein